MLNWREMQLLARFRVGPHALEIEAGSRKKIPRLRGCCKLCRVVEDEEHLLFQCLGRGAVCQRFTCLLDGRDNLGMLFARETWLRQTT